MRPQGNLKGDSPRWRGFSPAKEDYDRPVPKYRKIKLLYSRKVVLCMAKDAEFKSCIHFKKPQNSKVNPKCEFRGKLWYGCPLFGCYWTRINPYYTLDKEKP
jgi:hypothetical protein